MAGHSQFKNIMHRKGRQDAMRSKLVSKLARQHVTMALTGDGGDELFMGYGAWQVLPVRLSELFWCRTTFRR